MGDLADRIARLSPEKRALLVQELLKHRQGAVVPVQAGRRREPGQTFPLSFAQESLWFLEQLTPGGALYNIPAYLRLDGHLDVAALEQGLRALVRRHEVLRTTFGAVAGRPVQIIAPQMPIPVDVVDLRAVPAAARAATAQRRLASAAQQPFDLARGPLLRAVVVRLADDEHLLLLAMHHIIADGWSLGVLCRELGAFYGAALQGREADVPALPLQYADYAAWQRAWLRDAVLEEHLSYWRSCLQGAPAVLALPTDRPRPAVQSHAGAAYPVVLPAALTAGLRALSRREGVTLFMTLLAAFQLLLARDAAQQDIVVGTPIAGRTRTETEGLIGFFVNTLALRADLTGAPSFRELLRRVREVALGAYAHQDLPFEKLVEELHPARDPSRSPLVQVMCELHNTPPAVLTAPGLAPSRMELLDETAKFDLTLSLVDAEERLGGSVVYNADLFSAPTIKRMVGQFQTLLEGAVANPAQVVWEMPMRAERVELEAEELDELFV